MARRNIRTLYSEAVNLDLISKNLNVVYWRISLVRGCYTLDLGNSAAADGREGQSLDSDYEILLIKCRVGHQRVVYPRTGNCSTYGAVRSSKDEAIHRKCCV